MFKVMMVCTGNICRSPMAEIVLREKLRERGLEDLVQVDSTGISNEEAGNSLDRRARKVLVAAGYSDTALETHIARQLSGAMLTDRDLVLVMTARHASAARRLAERVGVESDVIRMFRSFDPAAPSLDEKPEHTLDVDDPWYGGMRDFEVCLEQVEAAVVGLVEYLEDEVNA